MNANNNILVIEKTVEEQFLKMCGKDAARHIASVVQLYSTEEMLQKCSPASIWNCALTAASVGLSVNKQLGHAYIVPYWNKKNKQHEAQFQLGYRGLIQLCHKNKMPLKRLGTMPIYKGQMIKNDPVNGHVFDFSVPYKIGDKPVGYIAYVHLKNGFSKEIYMTFEQIEIHAKKYSSGFKENYGPWATDFDAMALKTVLKKLLLTYVPNIDNSDIQTAILTDQAVIEGIDSKNGTINVDYVDAVTPVGQQESDDYIASWTTKIQKEKNLNKLRAFKQAENFDIDNAKLVAILDKAIEMLIVAIKKAIPTITVLERLDNAVLTVDKSDIEIHELIKNTRIFIQSKIDEQENERTE